MKASPRAAGLFIALGALPLAAATTAAAVSTDGSATAVAVNVVADKVADWPYATTWDTPDGNDDAVADFSVEAAGTHTITQIDIRHVTSGWWLSTGSGTDSKVGIADRTTAPRQLVNAADGTVSIAFTDSIELRAYMFTDFEGFPMPRQDGDTYEVQFTLEDSTILTARFSYPVVEPTPIDTGVDTTVATTDDTTVVPVLMPGTGSGSSTTWVASGLLGIGVAALLVSRRRLPAQVGANRTTRRG